jgi:hypothetical protein
VDDVAVLDHVVLAFQEELAGFAALVFPAQADEVIEGCSSRLTESGRP